MYYGPQGHLTCRHVISNFGGNWRAVYTLTTPRNLNELKDAIRHEVLMIDQQLLARAVDDFKRRIENYIQEDGRHLNDISWPLIW